ncbi:sulfatase-like hydrolase/transferase [Roseiconus nitratireducens]|uniref:Sulfatase-like hydrolase/transferase n=1 Tax=Roseiconus nitratireducens TaxID=2605748 RepID=A0A5M6D3I6_9BACT|nr:sulfatase-like hydrolase/transferase [Roseiconus nitratireducens]KAA5540289.1 sulfatase-like hydrolase/transferase [Roseiconus nitratireducens]
MQRPNIIFIITDQQRYDTIAGLGHPHVDTPHLDRLVREGVSFDQCHVTAASCAAARASLFKGYFPHTTGILKNADRWRRSWIERLNDAGYYCTNIGKMHTWPYLTELGFHERFVVENKDRYLEGRYFFDEWDKALRFRGLVKQQREQYRKRDDYRSALGAFEWLLPEDTHPDMFVGDMAKWWIETTPRKDPLFLQIGFPGPHPPYDPIGRYAQAYLEKDLPLLPVTEEELDSLPPALKELRVHNSEIDHDSVVMPLEVSQQQRHRQRAFYLANVTMIDEKVGQIMKALETSGYADNSIVIFTSDHGDCLTDHGQSQKWTMYEQITRVPMIIWAPSRFPGGRSVAGLVQQMDLGPTILEWAGVEVPSELEAVSLAPALQDPAGYTGRDFVYCEQVKDAILTGCEFMTMVRDKTHKLVHFLDEPHGQLFDLVADPDELVNRWDHPEAAGDRERLLTELREWRIRSGVQTKDWCQEHR